MMFLDVYLCTAQTNLSLSGRSSSVICAWPTMTLSGHLTMGRYRRWFFFLKSLPKRLVLRVHLVCSFFKKENNV
jgi:hypothetical protein